MNKKTIGVVAVLFASLMWALEPIFAKLAYAEADFLQTQLVRVGIVALIALAYAIVTNRGGLRLKKNKISKIVYIAVVGILIGDLLYFYAILTVPVLNAVLIGHLQPIFVIIFGFFVLKEDKLTKFDYIGIMFMLVAGLFVTTKTFENLLLFKIGTFGDLFVLLATVAWATTVIVMRKYLKEMNAGVVTFYRFFIVFIILLVYQLSLSPVFIPNVFQLALGIVGGIGVLFYYESIKRIKAAQVSALELAAPFFAAALGLMIFGELVTAMQLVGLSLLFVGVLFLAKKERG